MCSSDLIIFEKFKKGSNDYAYCDWIDDNHFPREFAITIDATLSKRETFEALAHEMVHVKQFALGELIWPEHNKYPKWFGKRINYEHTSYWDLPYEVEAHGREKGLVYQWCDERKLWKESWYRELF